MEFIYDYTEDGLKLQGTYFEAKDKDICVVLVHGMCGTIIDNYFATVWGSKLSENNIGFLYGHNRGHSIENDIVMKDGTFKRYGCMYEIFEECIYDIDLWINKAKQLGYKRIILAGHSLGCNKVVYYYYQKRPDILGMMFASAPDMKGTHIQVEKDYDNFLNEAMCNINNDEPRKLLNKMVEDYMYMSSQTYYNWFKENSNIDNFPILRNPEKWEQLALVDVPILAFAGAKEEETYLQLDLIKEKSLNCPNFYYEIIPNSGHTYTNCEKETAEVIFNWINKSFN